MLLVDLNGNWKMRRVGDNDWIDAKVPGSVYADLMNADRMKDPFYRENETDATALCNDDYEYMRTFVTDASMLEHDLVALKCEGLDTLCDLLINDIHVLNAQNMHRTYQVDIKKVLLAGENTIRVVFHSPNRFIEKKHRELPLDHSTDTMHGFSYLRKAQYMFGWDWGPKLPDMGIWRGISITGWDKARIKDVWTEQEHADGKVKLIINVKTEDFRETSNTIQIQFITPKGKMTEHLFHTENGSGNLSILIDNPELWWPNGMGEHPLYTVQVSLRSGGVVTDSRRLRVGLRTLTVRMDDDQWGQSFAFTVNGIPFFAMGANYIPEDSIISRINRGRTEKLIKTCVDSHFNMLRAWGGGYYLDDYFYDLCDENGLVVWQDLAYACSAYPFNDAFWNDCMHETVDNVKRIRHHACLGMWCGNNEMESAWVDWGWKEMFGPVCQADYVKQFELMLPDLMKKLDPDRLYWHSSPSSGGCFNDPSSETRGDMHYWGVWHGLEPFTAFRQHFPRFMSEFGLQSFPELKTVESFTVPEDRNIFSPVMESHQKNAVSNGKILYYISETYRYPKNFEALLDASQLIQAEGIRYAIEHMRRNRGRCMGTLYWQVNDCWPVASWSSIDYYGRWKALQYEAKRFYAPVLVSAYDNGPLVSLHVTNDTPDDFKGVLKWKLVDDDSCKEILSGETEVNIKGLSTQECKALDFSDSLNGKKQKRSRYLTFCLYKENARIGSGTVLFVKPKHFNFKAPDISTKVTESETDYLIDVSAKAYARYVKLSLTDADAIFSDNYFDLAGGETKQIQLPKAQLTRNLGLGRLISQLRAVSVYDLYEHDASLVSDEQDLQP